jgi:hypothetical protein
MLQGQAGVPVLSETARTALLEASVDPTGNILRTDFDGGLAFFSAFAYQMFRGPAIIS